MAEKTVPRTREETAAPRAHPRRGAAHRAAGGYIRRGDGLVVVADMPGVGTGDVDVRVEQGILTLQARASHAAHRALLPRVPAGQLLPPVPPVGRGGREQDQRRAQERRLRLACPSRRPPSPSASRSIPSSSHHARSGRIERSAPFPFPPVVLSNGRSGAGQRLGLRTTVAFGLAARSLQRVRPRRQLASTAAWWRSRPR